MDAQRGQLRRRAFADRAPRPELTSEVMASTGNTASVNMYAGKSSSSNGVASLDVRRLGVVERDAAFFKVLAVELAMELSRLCGIVVCTLGRSQPSP